MSLTDPNSLNLRLHAQRLPASTPGMQVIRTANLSYIDCGLSCDTFNVLSIDNGAALTLEELQDAVNHYRYKNFAFTLWVNEANCTDTFKSFCQRLALTKAASEPGLTCDVAHYTSQSLEGHDIRLAKNPEMIAEFAGIVARNWNPPDPHVLTFYRNVTPALLRDQTGITLANYYLDDTVVAAMEIFPTDAQNVGIYSVCTLEAYRGRGIGTALMKFALNLAKERSYTTAVLQASEDGLGIYKRLGFVEKTMFYEYQE